jgi:A/G-specific adenine glycosylase
VVARLYSLRGNLHQSQFRRTVEKELAALLSHREPGNFNQAMMELGQTVCLPRGPRCSTCPLARWCGGYRGGNPEDFPLARPRRAAETHHLAVALIRRGTTVAMVQGLEEGLLDDLWNFPSALGVTPSEALESLKQKVHRLTRGSFTIGSPFGKFRHTITYRSIQGEVYPIETARPICHTSLKWFELGVLPQAAISKLARKIVQKIS